MIIVEDRRNELVAKSKSSQKGLQRFRRRLKSRVSNSTKEYNRIDMNKLFKEDILEVNIKVHGETDEYLVGISFSGFLDELQKETKRSGKLELREVIRALVNSFNKDNVYIKCSCPDFKYRFNYWATKNDIVLGQGEIRPSNITNPDDNLGPACKHIYLILSNTSWLLKIASVIRNYINYCEKNLKKAYADIIYPAVYGKKYEEPVQLSLLDKDELDTDEETIDKSNQEARTKTQFKSGNPYRYQKQEKEDETIPLDIEEGEE